MKRIILIFAMLFSVVACDMIKYYPYGGETEYTDINANNMELILAQTADLEEFSFVWMGDSQRFYDDTEDFVKYVNANVDADFVLHGGDISDFGMTFEFEAVHDIMKQLKVPYMALIGNHDILGTGRYTFDAMYGDDNFSFTVADVRFICLNTNALEYEDDTIAPNFDYIEAQLSEPDAAPRTIVVMHAPPCGEQLGVEKGTQMHQQITQFDDLLFCANAHGHNTKIEDIFEDGVIYYQCASMKGRSFFLFTITREGYQYEEIFF